MRYLLTLLCFPLSSVAQINQLSVNGYSGVGMVPVATALEKGVVVISNDYTIPSAKLTSGSSSQVGLGLQDGLEVIGRLASNDAKCNMFVPGACPANTIRDFSGSIKYSFQNQWMKSNDAHIAIGATDIGGAATYFRSYYGVVTKNFDKVQLSLGAAQAKNETSPLKGNFALLSYSPEKYLKLSLQKVGPEAWAQVGFAKQLTDEGIQGWINVNSQITKNLITNKNWVGWGLSYPLDNAKKSQSTELNGFQKAAPDTVSMDLIELSDLQKTLQKYGFYSSNVFQKKDGSFLFVLNNNSYQWNDLDAVGVGLGLISRSLANEKNNKFKLILKKNGINFLAVESNAKCIKDWYQNSNPCGEFKISSLLNKGSTSSIEGQQDSEEVVLSSGFFEFRPEVVLTPSIVSAIGSEFGSFDADLGVNINTILPLWRGATLEENRVRPLGVGTVDFEKGGPFYYSRIRPSTTRKFLNQVVSFPEVNSAVRLSVGTLFSTLDGYQVESLTQSANGRHRVSLLKGHFKDPGSQYALPKDYYLTTYRYAQDAAMTKMSEITAGQFLNGDKGFNVSQKYWYGDTEIGLYFRRTRKSNESPLVSFAGIQVSMPLSFRFSRGFENLSIRGGNQWSYTIESKVLDKDNIITSGYGSIPNTGASLVQAFNRDRSGVGYFEAGMWRMKAAYIEMENQSSRK